MSIKTKDGIELKKPSRRIDFDVLIKTLSKIGDKYFAAIMDKSYLSECDGKVQEAVYQCLVKFKEEVGYDLETFESELTGSNLYYTFKVGDQYYRCRTVYDSWSEHDPSIDDVYEVFPYEKTVTRYAALDKDSGEYRDDSEIGF